jgi:hypothetical protein
LGAIQSAATPDGGFARRSGRPDRHSPPSRRRRSIRFAARSTPSRSPQSR